MVKILVQIRNTTPTENLSDVVDMFPDDWVPSRGDLANCEVISLPEVTMEEAVEMANSLYTSEGQVFNLGNLTPEDIDYIEDSINNNKLARINRFKNKVIVRQKG
jgi:hypothetical protein